MGRPHPRAAALRTAREAHGGRVTVDTRPGEGATFTIHAPLEEDEAQVVDVYVGYRRRNLGRDRIETVRGMGHAPRDAP